MIVGRKKEINKLNSLYEGNEAELVAVYGRRRVGKTFLIDEVFGNRITFYHSGLSPVDSNLQNSSTKKSKMNDQLEHFYRSLTLAGYDGDIAPTSWLDAFYMLEDLLMKKQDDARQLIFIDEIQWLDTPRANFMTGFEAFWNGWACHRRNIMVIVCGSSSSWILDNVINNNGGLYGRVTYEMKLLPFTLSECEEYFNANSIVLSRYDIAQAYMMLGGIPFYLKQFERELSLAQNIDELFFTGKAKLKDEYERLFSSQFSNSETMMKIINAIGTKNMGLTRKEIVSKTKIADSGEFSKQLKALIAGSFIIKYASFGNGKREDYYKLVDPFCLFYLHFIDGNTSKKINWINISDSAKVSTWRGYAFENVCWNHIPQIKKALGISGVVTSESLWSKRATDESDGTQIDLIIERKDNVVNMCEIKFYSEDFAVNKDYHFILERRRRLLNELIPKKSTIYNTLITTYGLKHNEYFGDFVNIVTLDDLFES